MESKQINTLKKISQKKKKNVLLLNPKLGDEVQSYPHNGLAILAAILKKRGHSVLVADYAFMRKNGDKDISFFMDKIKPDIIGISSYTPNAKEVRKFISRIQEINPKIPIMVGGPHATLYPDLLQKDKRIDYIFIGEAESTILDIVETCKKQNSPKLILSKGIVNLEDIPFPDFKTFYEWQSIRGYPLMTSRGCPNQCSFCAAADMAHRKWRFRKAEDSIKELEEAQKNGIPIHYVYVMDDNPTVYKKNFNKFLELFSKKFDSYLHIINVRADAVDEELLNLMKKCRCTDVTIGVEHAHPEVFKLVNKGEKIEDLIKACKLIKKHKFNLGMTFIVGLPGDNLKRTMASIRFCKMFNPEFVNFGLIVPFRNTPARRWFEEHNAKLDDEVGTAITAPKDFECDEPVVETPDFSKEERKKAYYLFLFGVAQNRLKLRYLPKIWAITRKYSLYSEFLAWLPHGIITSLKNKKMLATIALRVWKKEGLKKLIQKISTRKRI